MHHHHVKPASLCTAGVSAETSPGIGALKWERRPSHRLPFSLSAPLLARVLLREWEEEEEEGGREHPYEGGRQG